jgi:hypothetical protein
VADQIAEGIERDRKRTRADADMRVADADDIKEERHGEYRATATDQAERKPTAPLHTTARVSCTQEKAMRLWVSVCAP